MNKAISFCFDDGFRRSAETICDVFEARGLRACFAVLSRPEKALDPFVQGADIGGWDLWRRASAAGHEVASHGLIHEHYENLTQDALQASVEVALDVMEAEIPGFRRKQSVFHVPYLTAPQEALDWLGTQCLGVRVDLDGSGLNSWVNLCVGGLVNSVCYGPDRVAECALKRISNFAHEDGWLVLVLHGVDGEGWGSITRNELKQLLNLAESTGALIAPPSSVLFARLRSSYNSCEG